MPRVMPRALFRAHCSSQRSRSGKIARIYARSAASLSMPSPPVKCVGLYFTMIVRKLKPGIFHLSSSSRRKMFMTFRIFFNLDLNFPG